jgi:hypothetical protein
MLCDENKIKMINAAKKCLIKEKEKQEKIRKIFKVKENEKKDLETKSDRTRCAHCNYYLFFSCVRCYKCNKSYCLKLSHILCTCIDEKELKIRLGVKAIDDLLEKINN